MFSEHEKEDSSTSSPTGQTNPKPGTFSQSNRVAPQTIYTMRRAMSLDRLPSTLIQQNYEFSGQRVAGTSGQPSDARPSNPPIRTSPVARAHVLGSYSPIGMGQVCPQALRQVIKESKVAKAKKAKMKVIRECEEMPIELTCAGDDHLEVIVAGENMENSDNATRSLSAETPDTENDCWMFLPICPGQKSTYDFVVGILKSIITCAPLRYLFCKFCVHDNMSGASLSDSEAAYRSSYFESQAIEYMDQNPRFVEEYMLEHVSLEMVTSIYLAKLEREQELTPVYHDLNDLSLVGKPDFIRLINGFNDDIAIDEILLKLADEIIVALTGEAYRIFRVYPEGHAKYMEVYSHSSGNTLKWLTVTEAETQCMEALRRNSIMCFTRATAPLKLSIPCQNIFIKNSQNKDELTNMILIPTFGQDSELTYFIEIWRGPLQFKVSDVEIAKSFMLWSSLAIMYYIKWNSQRRHNKLNTFLLESVKAVFEDVLTMDQVVKCTLEYVQKLVDADRASLFMLDEDTKELVSRVFDLGGGGQVSADTVEIRIPIDRGIAGHVASTGETVNIADVYADTNFNHDVDEATGYRTTSILCMPVKVDRKVIGVVQMVNKRSADNFSSKDERSFNIFSTFFGLALHNAGVYDIIARNEQKYRVALDVLSYHNTCRENEVMELRNLEPLHKTICLHDFYLDPFKFNPLEKCQAVMAMFNDLFSLKNFDCNSLTRFVLTVKKNYREVPYHNFHHGWSVAQSMYAILKADAVGRFSYKQRLALFVASLCHDLDHRGYTNKYMSETASPLASMYTTSTLEHHHFNITVTILQQDGHNIFDRFGSEEFKDMLGLIKTCILATDLAAFFPNLAQLEVECKGNYDWSNNEHSKLAMALSMTAADLSAAAKPWDIQIETVKVIFEEFYDQGDKERNAGRKPIPMMDRDKPQEQPASQVGFLTSICLPCYGMLKFLLPSTDKMFLMAVRNLEIWQRKATDAAEATKADLVEHGDSSLYSSEGKLDTDVADAAEDSLFSNEDMASMTSSENREVIETLREIRVVDDAESHSIEKGGDSS